MDMIEMITLISDQGGVVEVVENTYGGLENEAERLGFVKIEMA